MYDILMMKMSINLLSAFNTEAKENNQCSKVNDTTATSTAELSSRTRSRALPERSTLELMIENMLPLPDKGGRPVICCLDFGIDYYERKENYPTGFFCSNCNQFVEKFMLATPHRQKKMIPNTGRYKCRAGHTDLATPAQSKPHHSLFYSMVVTGIVNDGEEDDGEEDDFDDDLSREY